MKRLLYFTGYRLSVLHWKGKALMGSSSFEPTDHGLQQFRHYLLQTENISANLLVDVIEEDFRLESVPHVSRRDRQSVINRLIDRYYRSNEEFCFSEIIGREKTGRKDDIVLLGAMTSPQLIQPWLSVLEECEVALSGIWTLPLVSKKILKIIDASSGAVLLISQQANSNIRQTLFRDGKLMFSRQSIINQEVNNISEVEMLAAPEVSRTIDFLRTQNLVEAHEIISLHVLARSDQLLLLQQSFRSNEIQTVAIHPIVDIHKKLGLTGVNENDSDSVFAWLCFDNKLFSGHYGMRKTFTRYHNQLAAKALYAASLLVVVSAVLISSLNMSYTVEFKKSISVLKQEEQNYQQIYADKFKDFEEVFKNAGVMNAAVDLADRIILNGLTSPLDFLISLSEVLTKADSRNLHIDKIEWKAVNDVKKSNIRRANFTSKSPVKHKAIVTGRIDDPNHNYRASIEHIERIIDYLKNSSRIESVQVLQMPVDLRSESKFSSQSGVNLNEDVNTALSGVFTFEITMKSPDRV